MNYFYIAGASSRSRTARIYLEYLNADMKISAFLVSPEMTDNESVVDDVPVLTISAQNQVIDTSLSVYLGTRGVNHPKLEAELRAIGFTEIIPVDMQLDSYLRNAYLTKYYAENCRKFIRMDMLSAMTDETQSRVASVKCGKPDGTADTTYMAHVGADTIGCIYVACSIFDGKLEDEYKPLPEEHRLQVGCDLTEERLEDCDTFDNEGEHISSLNRYFCELTGLYWIWKNAKEDYVGLVHYRRHFLLQSDWVEVCRKNEVDAILPVPLYVNPSVSENYRERHIASDWDYLMQYFRKALPDEYDDIVRILGGNLYSPCNMVIARREVLNELCTWMFPIIFDVYEHCGVKDDPYQCRYPGFISERLITYYFESRRDRYSVVYCNKNFLR